MRPREDDFRTRIVAALDDYEAGGGDLPGISDEDPRKALIQQLIESTRQPRYIEVIQQRDISPSRSDPRSPFFDPVKAAIFHSRNGNLEEAFWLAFLATHFGRNHKHGWRYCAAVYAGPPGGPIWDWAAVSHNPTGFALWVSDNCETIRAAGGGFGNHRKYESLGSTGDVVSSYVSWIGAARNQQNRFQEVMEPANGAPLAAFDFLYVSMGQVFRFGRTARFDFLTLLSRLRLLPIAPPRAYLQNATGPLDGAKLLFDSSPTTPQALDRRLTELDQHLRLGPDILEDALCNWQKSPTVFKPFRG
jgi:Alpha-glutamyl/putrescinyl thymine pyrophosphorylase clade 3